MNRTSLRAVRVASSLVAALDSRARLKRLHEEFASLLGVERIYVRQQGSEYFVTGDPNDTLLHQAHSPLSGRPRYDWDDQGNGILHGYSSISESAE